MKITDKKGVEVNILNNTWLSYLGWESKYRIWKSDGCKKLLFTDNKYYLFNEYLTDLMSNMDLMTTVCRQVNGIYATDADIQYRSYIVIRQNQNYLDELLNDYRNCFWDEHRIYHSEQYKYLYREYIKAVLRNTKASKKAFNELQDFEKYSLQMAKDFRRRKVSFRIKDMRIYNSQKQLFL
ncbi:hypothetical protein V9L05_18905 [Bernardetia sp. Wsw4-3y2]|uniref:hypothetical protein n=1 Tax=Bernardetia sp. Wsw4-3y2 TaxID=3127471 RepID=UPI0030D2C57F